jgi:type IV secretory pathway TraG/TraD family ATPase VirD4
MTSLRKYECFHVLGVNDPTYWDKYGKDAPVFMNEAGLEIWMKTRSIEGSEKLSKKLGEMEVEAYSKNVNWSPGYDWENPSGIALQRGVHANESHSLSKKPLLLPHEVRELAGRSIVFMDGVPGPILAEPRGYFKIPWLRRRASRNPFWKG